MESAKTAGTPSTTTGQPTIPAKRPKKTLLIGSPGSGKTKMAVETAVRRPVHVLDIDNKIGSSDIFRPLIIKGELTYVEVNETFNEESLLARVKALTKGEKLEKQPLGWQTIAEKFERFPKTEEGKRAGTWVWDSATLASEHLKSLIAFYAQRNKFFFDQWSAFLSGWRDTLKYICDLSLAYDKDLIMTVHERTKEVLGERITGIKLERVANPDGSVGTQRLPQGTLDAKILPTIDGSFGEHMAAYFDDVYGLSVEIRNDKPVWVCRVTPDGKRDLRCSFPVDKDEYPPDFRIIWGVKK